MPIRAAIGMPARPITKPKSVGAVTRAVAALTIAPTAPPNSRSCPAAGFALARIASLTCYLDIASMQGDTGSCQDACLVEGRLPVLDGGSLVSSGPMPLDPLYVV